jgi:hypothetical protein
MRWSVEELIYGLKVASNNELKLRYRIIGFPAAVWRMTKVFFKWVFTGYCWATIWDLDHYLMTVFIQRLKMFKKMGKNGYPFGVVEDLSDDYTDEEAREKWIFIIDRLIHGFEIMDSDEYADDYESGEMKITKRTINGKEVNSITFDRTPEQEEAMKAAWKKQTDYNEETMALFIKYFRDLWD